MNTSRPFLPFVAPLALPLALLAFAVIGCDGGSPPAVTPSADAPRDTPTAGTRPTFRKEPPKPTSRQPKPSPKDPSPSLTSTAVEQGQPPEPPAVPPEPLPAAPIRPGHALISVNPEKTVYVEMSVEDKKPRRVFLTAEVCLREGSLELFLCKKNTKEHEAIVTLDLGRTIDTVGRENPKSVRVVHAALVAAGAARGKPVQFVNPTTNREEFKPPSGGTVAVTVHYRKDGKLHTHPAQEWIWDRTTKKVFPHAWVFPGSLDIPPADGAAGPTFYGADSGDVISIANFPTAMLDVPVQVSMDNDNLTYEARTDRIPPLQSKVWVILEPGKGKK